MYLQHTGDDTNDNNGFFCDDYHGSTLEMVNYFLLMKAKKGNI